jgi:putative ABC transport system permease protein
MPFVEVVILAFEALRANKLRASLTMLGMIIGVAAVVLLVSIGNGAKNYITREFEGLGTNLIVVQPGKTDTRSGFGPPIGGSKERMTMADVDALEKQASNLDGVTGIVFGTASVKYQDRATNVNLMGCNEQFARILNVPVAEGQFITREEDDASRRVVVLGQDVARRLFDDDLPLGQMVKVNEIEHRVTGVLRKSGQTLGFNMDEIIFVPTRTAMRIFNDEKLFGIRTKARTKVSLDDAVEEVRDIFKARNNGVDNVTITTQVQMLSTMNTILDMLTYVLAGIAFISLLVGGIGIMNIMLVSVTERTREIGIRRAVGARKVDILKQFIVEAVALSIFGGAIGLLVSILLTYSVYWINPKFDMRAPYWILIPAFLLSSVIGIVFGVWPARKAAHIETIDALRYE